MVETDTDTDTNVPDIEPLSVDLGGALPGELIFGAFTVRNVGAGPLSGTLTVGGSAGFSLDMADLVLDPGMEVVVGVSFSATAPADYLDSADIASDDPDEPILSVSLHAVVGEDLDLDGDGWIIGDDCDDADPTANPGATEVWYDGVDQDCDGNDDDQELDGISVADDCDDLDAAVAAPATR